VSGTTIGASAALAILLMAGSVIDARTLRLPDWVTLSLVAIGLMVSWATHGAPGLASAAVGAACGFAALWMVAALYRRWSGAEGLGLGDAKLLAAAGAWLGPLALAPVVLIASVTALLFLAGRALAGHSASRRTVVPFGPFLSLGFAGVWGLAQIGWGP
jgi:leader peptidase (prepilin peptidase)/N-methyltransferase